MEKKKVTLLLAVVLLVAALALSLGTAYARYQESIGADLNFQVKPMEKLTIAKQEWSETEDGAYALTFSMEQEAQNCRIYLAVTDGATPENLTVTLTLPAEEESGGETAEAEPVVLTAAGEKIPEASSMYLLFGPGYVFRFLDEDGQQVIFDLTTEDYNLTVQGLDTAVQQTSLLRLFVEYAN